MPAPSKFLAIASVTLSAASSTLAQDWSIPSNWREPSTDLGWVDRINTAQDAINSINSQLDPSTAEYSGIGYWPTANVLSSLGLLDYYTTLDTNRDTVTSSISKAFSLYGHADKFQYNDDALWWGNAAFYAYLAYEDTAMLNLAIDNWNGVAPYQITEEYAQAGKHPLKDTAISSTCTNGATMAGGMFWRPTADDSSVNAITTSLFATLSAYLAQATGDDKYRSAAELAANWVNNHLFAPTGDRHLVWDGIGPSDCAITDWTFTYNQGKFIESAGLLADLTGDAKYVTWMQDAIIGGTKGAPWTGTDDGIITEGQETPQSENGDGRGFKAIFIRSLAIANNRDVNSGNTGLQDLVRSYIDVQYNALLDLARNGNDYSPLWHGPFEQFYTHGQMSAVQVLVAAVTVNE